MADGTKTKMKTKTMITKQKYKTNDNEESAEIKKWTRKERKQNKLYRMETMWNNKMHAARMDVQFRENA